MATKQELAELDVNAQVIWGLHLRKLSVAEIARKKRLTPHTVERILAAMRATYQHRNRELVDAMTQTQLTTLDYIIGEAAIAWEASKAPMTQITRGDVVMDPRTGSLLPKPDVKVTRQRCGDQIHLQTMMKAMAEQRKMLGLDAPDKHELTLIDDDAKRTLQVRLEELAARSEVEEDGEAVLEGFEEEPRSERSLLGVQVETHREQKRTKRVETLSDAVRADRTDVGLDLEVGDGGMDLG